MMPFGPVTATPGLPLKRQPPRVIPTPRELDVMRLLPEGWSNKAIGRKLGMSESTVKVHVQKLMRVYAARNRVRLAVIAARQEAL